MGNRLGGFAAARPLSGLILTLTLLAPLAMAGQQEAAIYGQVVDASGGVLPGVIVTASSPALQLREVTVVTDQQGNYRLTPLPIGTYNVTYTLAGFQSATREAVRLTGGFSARLDTALAIGAVAETVVVSGASPLVDVASTSTTTPLVREVLEAVPVARVGLNSVLAQAPGVRAELDVGGTAQSGNLIFSAFGQWGESWQMIEGMAVVSSKNGQAGQFWDYTSVEEAVVTTVAAEASQPTRGVGVNMIFKSGGNDFRGSAFVTQVFQRLQSNNLDAGLRAQGVTTGNPLKERWDRGAQLGGRIVRDKLWFYYSGRKRKNETYFVNRYKEDGSPATGNTPQRFSTEKVSYQLNHTNRIEFLHQWGSRNILNPPGQFAAYSSRSWLINNLNVAKVGWQFAPSSSLMASLQFGRWGFHGDWMGFSDDVYRTDQLTGKASGFGLGAQDVLGEHRFHTAGSVSWLAGDHQIRSGFDDIAEWHSWGSNSRGVAGNYYLILRNDSPFQVATLNYPVRPRDTHDEVALWAQDAWKIHRRLTLNMGLRYNHDGAGVPEQCREAVGPPTSLVEIPATCFAKVQFKVFQTLVPRLHMAFDVSGDGKTVIKGGWARFAHRHQADEIEGANKNASAATFYRWHDLNGNKQYDAGEVDLNLNGSDFVSTQLVSLGTAGALANGVPNPNIQVPLSDEVSVAVERELMPNFAVRAVGIYARNTNVYRLQNNKRPYSVYSIPVTNPDPGPDGRVGTVDDPGTILTYFEYPAALTGTQFQESMLVNDPTATQTYKSVGFDATKRLSNAWQVMASYTATKKHDPFVDNSGGLGSNVLTINTFDPNAEIFAADDTWEWLSKVFASYDFPADVQVSAKFEHRSGNPYARTVSVSGGRQIPSLTMRVEPIGTRRLPHINLLDLRVQKAIRLPRGQRVTVQANVYNATNVNSVTGYTSLSGPNFLRPNGIVPPRIAEINVSYRF